MTEDDFFYETDDIEDGFFYDMVRLQILSRKAVYVGITLPHVVGQRVSPIEAAAANAADVPTVGLRFPDRTKEKFTEWPERII